MLTQECLVSTRFVLIFMLYLACHGRGARQHKAVAILAELFFSSIGQVPKWVCLKTMVPTANVERTSVELCSSLSDSATIVVVDGSAKVLRALGGVQEQSERAFPILKVLSRIRRRWGSGSNRRYICVGVANCGRQLVRWIWEANDGAHRGYCRVDATLAVEERFQRVDSGTKLMCSIGAIRQKRAKTISSFVWLHRGGSSFAGMAESSCRNRMVKVVPNSVAWSRRVFARSGARRICISAYEFNRESSRMIFDLP